MAFFVGDIVDAAKEKRTGQKDSEGGRAYIQEQAINNDDDDGDSRGTKRPRYLGETATRPLEPVQSTTIQ